MNRFITSTLLAVFFILSLTTLAQLPTPVACYNFSGNLNEANGGTPMTSINGAGSYSSGASLCGTDSLYSWALDQGLDLSIGSVFPKNHYTIEFLFEFTGWPYQRLWQRIINFKNSTSDLGLYSYGSGTNFNIQMYTVNTGTTNMMAPNTWIHLFVTRDSLTQTMNVYINDSLQISFTDNASAGVFISDLILFKDDNVVQNEESPGLIDYLRIYDTPLTRVQVSTIVNFAQPVVSVSGNLAICSGDSTLLIASGATNYLWSNGATDSSIYVSPSSTATFSVAGWDDFFCTKSCMAYDSIIVIINTNTAAIAGPDTSVCSGSLVQLFSTGGSSYVWSPSTNLSDSTIANPVAFPFESTIYTVTVSNGNCVGTQSVTISIFPAPSTPSITPLHDTLYCSTDSSYAKHQWYSDSSLIPGATNSFLVVSANGNYNIQVTDHNGCSVAVGINVVLDGLDSVAINGGGGRVFPNPVTDNFIVSGLKDESSIEIKIYNSLGEMIYADQRDVVNGKLKSAINVSSLRAGLYFVRLSNTRQASCGHFIKN